ncbi:MAG TPA: LptF/LptG family permease [Bacteroidia bacterium]|jgi:lipopolysaccharide export system permease protein|nr:LptF/LptG family permease [Bacteroidia bacterium]
MRLKTLHIFLIKKYIPPFLATLFIGMFIFLMIFTFTYIDEIAGKGVETSTLIQMFGYIFLTFLPDAMPLAVLLSSIMTFGNLGETYELASMKSAGQSLLSIMRPVLVLIIALSCFCFFYSNYTLPYIHLKAAHLLYNVRASKPAFNLKEGVYYNGIDGYTIKVGNKDKDGITIHNIYIYDHTEGLGNTVQMYAKDGEISMTKDMRYLTFKLKDGTHYNQPLTEPKQQVTRPNMIMHFKQQNIRIDLSSLKMENYKEDFFKGDASMLNIGQLHSYRDSSEKYRKDSYHQTYQQFINQYFFQKSLVQNKKNEKDTASFLLSKYLVAQTAQKKKLIYESAANMIKSAASYMESKSNEEEEQKAATAKYAIEWHKKFTVSFACLILFFVGAPLGAIVRKGGFGMPVVISVLIFIIYHVVTITLVKMVSEGKLQTVIGMWASQCFFLPIGLWLSFKAANDSPILEGSSYTRFFKKLFTPKENNANTAINQ